MKNIFYFLIFTCLLFLTHCETTPEQVGPIPSGGDNQYLVPTHQWIRPAGETVAFNGRPVDLVLAPDGETLYLKDNRGLVVVDAETWTVRQELPFQNKNGSSMHGITISRDGKRVYATTAQDALCEAEVQPDGTLAWKRRIVLPGPGQSEYSHPCGIALSPDEKTAYVCLSRNNTLAVIDLNSETITKEIPVGVAPFDVVIRSNSLRAYVSNWGGRHPQSGEPSAPSSDTPVVVDERGIGASGTVSLVHIPSGYEIGQVETGLHPSDLLLSPDEKTLYAANANSDTVSAIDAEQWELHQNILVHPRNDLPFGSATNALALSADGSTLYAANGGNNAVAVISVPQDKKQPFTIQGFIPTSWYPGGIVTDGQQLFVANVKGNGSRYNKENKTGRHVYWYEGTTNKIALPDEEALKKFTAQVIQDTQVQPMLQAWEKQRSGQPPVPVPQRAGEPSVFEHVVYIIKENRTYDQVLGDLPQGNGDPELCIFGREVTPNHHKLAEEFVLLDNFYCNGVNSSDGHSWATEGYVTDHLEKSFGGYTRSYTWGDDPLNYSSAGFIWDNVLLHGLTFRNYGEMDYAYPIPKNKTFLEMYRDYTERGIITPCSQNIGIEPLRRYSSREYPGWNMDIPEIMRAEIFLRELRECEERGQWYNFVMIFMGIDHTSGTTPGSPTPRAQVADNDLALGRVIEGITKSKFWPKTCIIVIEDDPQDGFDHVDGHRSIALVASPYTKRGAVVSKFYNQTSVLHTMERIMGIPPMNQMDSLAPVMYDCFNGRPDYKPYTHLPNQIPLDEMNPEVSQLQGQERYWAMQSKEQPLDELDKADEDTFNRILWHSVKGVDVPYPVQYAGAHGKGLKELGLVLSGEEEEE